LRWATRATTLYASNVTEERNPDSPAAASASREDSEEREVALRRVRKFVATYVAKGKYELYPEPEVVENVIQGLADNLVVHGRMYCPCADVEDSKKKGSDMVCPCKPHPADIARQGYCDCALFADPQFVAAERLKKKAT
jgi:ferredoxin-thioredoxin reductase catalytic subunit